MIVRNMTNNKGNKVFNQFTIENCNVCINNVSSCLANGTMFQSYTANIVFITSSGKVYLDTEFWDYSVKTGKYRNLFLGEKKSETQKKIDSGEYFVTDLNK